MFILFTDPLKRTEADNIQAAWSDVSHEPYEAELKRAAQLAQEGYLSSVTYMRISNKNLSEIPSDQLAKLASIVTYYVDIDNYDNITPESQLSTILANVQCTRLELRNVTLSEENTQALVTAMRERVERVTLDDNITLDIEQLTKYDGQGRCRVLAATMTRHGDRLRRWAANKGWTVTRDHVWGLGMERK